MRFFKFITKFLIIPLLILVLFSPLVVFVAGFSKKPLNDKPFDLSVQDVQRLKYFIKQNDPRKLEPNEKRQVIVDERDLNLFIGYSLNKLSSDRKVYSNVSIHADWINIGVSIHVPEHPFAEYLNFSAVLYQSLEGLRGDQAKIGYIKIPGIILNFLWGRFEKLSKRDQNLNDLYVATQAIKRIEFREKKLCVSFQWTTELAEQMEEKGRQLLLSESERKRLAVYQNQIAILSKSFRGKNTSLNTILQPMFEIAIERTKYGANPVKENEALIVALAGYSVRNDLSVFLGSEVVVKPSWKNLTLLQRNDLAKHFLISAALTVSAGSNIADIIGVYKESEDAKGGSGFSFADLAADRGGVTFAQVATGSEFKAKTIQQRMVGNIQENDYMPKIDHLPEGIMELEFSNRFIEVGSPVYKIVEREIENRINACAIYK